MAEEFVERDPAFVPDPLELGSGLGARAPRMRIIDVAGLTAQFAGDQPEHGYYLEAQYNPQQLEEELRVSWARMEVPGLSHRPLHYTGTENGEFTFDLTFDGLVPGMTVHEILWARQFLKSMCIPRRGVHEAAAGTAPLLLFVWPNFLRLMAVIGSLDFKYESFTNEGTPSRFTVSVKLESVRETRVFAEDIR